MDPKDYIIIIIIFFDIGGGRIRTYVIAQGNSSFCHWAVPMGQEIHELKDS